MKTFRIKLKKAITRKQKQVVSKLYKLLPFYYTKLNRIPLENWFGAMNGNLAALNKFNIKFVPLFFNKNYVNMIYQMEYLDLTLIKKKADYVVLKSMAERMNDKTAKFQADTLKKDIEKRQNESLEDRAMTLNQFIDFIELSFDSIGTIDASKISAARGYSLFEKAKQKNEILKKKKKNVYNRK
jgi:hypothetical protein